MRDGVLAGTGAGGTTDPVAREPGAVDLALEACLLDVNGQVVDSATGWLVLTGGMTDPVPCPPGTAVAAHFTTLGSVFLPL